MIFEGGCRLRCCGSKLEVNQFPFMHKDSLQVGINYIDEVTCDVSAVKISVVAPQYEHASLGKYF